MSEKKLAYNDYHDLMSIIKQSGKNYDLSKIEKAYNFALNAHKGQNRISGIPYILHPTSVAFILAELGMDTESIIAALLHDVVEDTEYSREDIVNEFSNNIANLVDGVTKLGKIPFSTREEQQAENLRKMLIAMYQDIRVIIIKLADRLHNMRTIDCMKPQKRRDKSLENMEVYAPIAHRLGIKTIKEELEDLSLKQLDPVAYKEIESALELKKNEREELLLSIKEKLKEKIRPFMNDVYITGRVKSINGIYRKIFVKGYLMEEIYDIYAVRVIVDSINECYNILGIIHDAFRPIPNRFKDYISTPKPNMYQSLHTTVIGKEGIPFEVQIRTWEMHHTAEYGIAAHWKYKLGISKSDNIFDERLMWIKNMIENQKEDSDAIDLVRTIKSDLVPEEVFVFTPQGKVINLPLGATVIDFAYAIHSEIGNHMIGAKVDKRIVPIGYKVKTGQIVEILTTKDQNHGPGRNWLNIVKTSEARSKIRQWFKKEKREENIEEGKLILEKEIHKLGIDMHEKELHAILDKIASSLHFKSAEKIYETVGYGGTHLGRIISKLKEEHKKIQKTNEFEPTMIKTKNIKSDSKEKSIEVEGIDNCLVKISKCCNPIPGDKIIGYITRGYGVSIHKRDCVNVPVNIENSTEPDRWIKVRWLNNLNKGFNSIITITAHDKTGLLADITTLLSSMHIKIRSLNTKILKDGKTIIRVSISVKNKEQLKTIFAKIKIIDGVICISRS